VFGCSGSNAGSLLASSEDLSEKQGIGVQAAAMQAADLLYSLACFAASDSSSFVAAAAALPALAAGLGFY